LDNIIINLDPIIIIFNGHYLCITESARNNPERFRLIFYNMPSSITDCYNSDGEDYAASYMYGGQIQQQQPQYLSPDDNTEANAAMIVDEAEKLFTKVVKDSINKTVQELKSTDATASDNKS